MTADLGRLMSHRAFLEDDAMDDALVKRVSAAAGAAWWTVLIWALWLTAAWLIWLGIIHAKPGWILALWGDNLAWTDVQQVTIWFFGAFKVLLLVAVMGSIWLTLYARRLKRA